MNAFTPYSLTCRGTVFAVDLATYKRALKIAGSFEMLAGQLEPHIDGVIYVDVCPDIINYICAATYANTTNNLKPITVIGRDRIPSYLAMFKWCEFSIHDSALCRADRTKFKADVLRIIKIVRATIGGTARDRLAALNGEQSPIKLPDYIVKYHYPITIASYAAKLSGTNVDVFLNNISTVDHRYKHTRIGELDKCSYNSLHQHNAKIHNYCIDREVKILCLTQPDWLKVADFGPECEVMMRDMFSPSELKLRDDIIIDDDLTICGLTICDVFRKGIQVIKN